MTQTKTSNGVVFRNVDELIAMFINYILLYKVSTENEVSELS